MDKVYHPSEQSSGPILDASFVTIPWQRELIQAEWQ